MNLSRRKMRSTLVCLITLISLSFNSAALAEPTEGTAKTKLSRNQLSDEEQEILEDGPISDGAYIAGGVLGTVIGLGIGHAVQGRYGERGWIFTAGELVAASMYVSGLEDCVERTFTNNSCDELNSTGQIGAIALLGLRIWEIVDVWAAPPSYNKRYRRIKRKIGENPDDEEARMNFILLPVAKNSAGVTAGVQFRF